MEEVRGEHNEHVFTYKGNPVASINNSAWKRIRKEVGLPSVRVHDLKHTFGRRLRAARVPLETRKTLLGHANGDITTHHSAVELRELIDAVGRMVDRGTARTPTLAVVKRNVEDVVGNCRKRVSTPIAKSVVTC